MTSAIDIARNPSSDGIRFMLPGNRRSFVLVNISRTDVDGPIIRPERWLCDRIVFAILSMVA